MDATHGKFLATTPVKQSRRNQLLEVFSPLVPMIAGALAQHLPPSFDRADLEQTGRLAILEAAPRVERFMRLRVEGAIRDSARWNRYREATHERLDVVAGLPDLAGSPLEAMLAAERAAPLNAALHALTPDQARVIELRIDGKKRGRPTNRDAAAEREALDTLRARIAA